MYKPRRVIDVLKQRVEAEQARNDALSERVGELMDENAQLKRENKKLRNMTYKRQKKSIFA